MRRDQDIPRKFLVVTIFFATEKLLIRSKVAPGNSELCQADRESWRGKGWIAAAGEAVDEAVDFRFPGITNDDQGDR